MMPIKPAHANLVLGAPKDWDESKNGTCMDLHLYRDEDKGVMFSYWRLTWKERLGILLGKPVRLAIFSNGHPAVALDVAKV